MQQKSNKWSEKYSVQIFAEFQSYRSWNRIWKFIAIEIKIIKIKNGAWYSARNYYTSYFFQISDLTFVAAEFKILFYIGI